ncbi:hypothetical protein GOV08_01040 [Candidatus Woesearchaeota archaeon]|nr:hypothetical protein [Candidatus Woesearchaeota archaeon]
MKITFHNFKPEFDSIEAKLKKISKSEDPIFARYDPAIKFFKSYLKPFRKYKKFIVIGHGGSITSTQGFYDALKKGKELFIIDTPQPDYIEEVRKLCPKKETLVIVVSKSGNSIDILEIMFGFLDYERLVITNPEEGALLEISKKLNLPFIEHPNVGGRFSAFTSSTLVPAFLLGFDIDKIFAGAKDTYKKCAPQITIEDNPALLIASHLYLADISGKHEVFIPIYSKKLDSFANLIIQLMHESSSKEGKGQTFYAASAPEAQHHTNQRFFGGRKNVCGFFIRTEKDTERFDKKIKVPRKLRKIVVRDGMLADVLGNSYADALLFESLGVLEHVKKNKIPAVDLMLEKVDEFELGQFVALWHYIGVYASLLRDVNPFDQPEVEYAKKVSFNLRKKK